MDSTPELELLNSALLVSEEFSPSTKPIEKHSFTDDDDGSVQWLANAESFLGFLGKPPKRAVQLAQFDSEVMSETTPSLSCMVAAIPLLEPREQQSFSKLRRTTDAPWPEMAWSGSMRQCISLARLNHPKPSPLPKPLDRSFPKTSVEF